VRFLADESCDAEIVRALRAAGHDVRAIAETMPGSHDTVVLDTALAEARTLITKDKDFGSLVFERKAAAFGVILVRWPSHARSAAPSAVVEFAAARGREVAGSFVVIEPGGVRVNRIAT
jgi:hypothetical protein